MERLKEMVEKEFGLRIKNWAVIKHVKNSSHVVRLVTEEGKIYVLKSLFIKPERQMFIVTSENLLAQKGVDLARPVPTLEGSLYMMFQQAPYVLYDWIEGKGGRLNGQRDLEAMVQLMAKFHLASRKLVYPPHVKIYTHLHWEKEYKQDIQSMKKWFNDHQGSKDLKDTWICRHIPFFIRMARMAQKQLKQNGYQAYFDTPNSEKTLVHGDFHHQNLIAGKKTLTLIDFEDIRYDLPSKDLQRIYSMYTRGQRFSEKSFQGMMKTYLKYNPLSPEMTRLVHIDLLFPHIFERLLRKHKYAKMSLKELKAWIRQEKKKAEYIRRYMKKREGLN